MQDFLTVHPPYVHWQTWQRLSVHVWCFLGNSMFLISVIHSTLLHRPCNSLSHLSTSCDMTWNDAYKCTYLHGSEIGKPVLLLAAQVDSREFDVSLKGTTFGTYKKGVEAIGRGQTFLWTISRNLYRFRRAFAASMFPHQIESAYNTSEPCFYW